MKTFLFTKNPLEDTIVVCDCSTLISSSETLTSVNVQAISPVSTPPLGQSIMTPGTDPQIKLLLTQGQTNVQYGFQIQLTTTARTLVVGVAVSVLENSITPYTSQDPEAYTDLVDSIEAGKSAVSTAVFSFPPSIDPRGGYVTWEFLDNQATVYAAGNAFDYVIQTSGLSNTVLARSIINCPSTVPPSDLDCKYQIRYTLTLDSDSTGQQQFYAYENLTVIGLTTVPVGTQDLIELQGITAQTTIVLDKFYDKVLVNLFQDNTLVGQMQVQEWVRTGSGYMYAADFDSTGLAPSLEPYSVIWQYCNSTEPTKIYSETSKLWITTPSVMDAVSDVKAMINKARTTLYGQPDLLFPPETIMLWLRRARDTFNGYSGVFTSFTMLNAKGAIREYWLMCAEMKALDSQYLAEGEKAFDFQGAAISLTVDRTQFLESMSSKIQGRLDNELKPFKQNLVIRGQTSGDGSADPTKLAQGAIGAVGITITPATPWGPFRSNFGFPSPVTTKIG